MPNLKGQNFRVFIDDGEHRKVVAQSTNCTVNYTANIEDASHKDITGMAALPSIVSKGCTIQVDSLDVSDIGAILTKIKTGTPFDLIWEETSTTDNQTPVVTDTSLLPRHAKAYLNDATFTFNDRENSAKNLQFTITGAIDDLADQNPLTVITPSINFTKGQYVRLFLGYGVLGASAVIAAGKSLSLHTSVSLQESTTKDTTGNWQVQTPTGISYDISTSALMRSGETITSTVAGYTVNDLVELYEADEVLNWKIANVGGDNNRTASSTIVSGRAIVTSLQLNGPNRQDATYNATLNGVGDYTVGA